MNYNNFVPASQPGPGTQAYGASAGPPAAGYHSAGGHSAPPAGQTSYDTAYPNTAAFAGYYGFAPKPYNDQAKNYFQGPGGPVPSKPEGPGVHQTHYQGYEAALYRATQAYLHQQNKSGGSIVGVPGPAKGAGPSIGGNSKARGRYFNGGTSGGGGNINQRWTSSTTQQLHYCEVCKISCASPQTYKDHLDGQKHKKKEAAVRTGLPQVPTPRTGAALHCELCNVTCTSSDAYAAHIRGTKHQKVVKLHTKLGKPIPPAEPQLIHCSKVVTSATPSTPSAPIPVGPVVKVTAVAPKINFLGGNFLNTAQSNPVEGEGSEEVGSNQERSEVPMTAAVATETALSVVAHWEEEKVIQPVGQDYVEELHGPDGKVNGFNCKLCDCRFNDVNAKDMHLKGRRHRLMYKKKVDPSLVVEAKGWPSQRKTKSGTTWVDRKKDREGFWDPDGFEDVQHGVPVIDDGQQSRQQPTGGYWPVNARNPRLGGHSIGLPPPQYYPTGPMPLGPPNPAMRKLESCDDRNVMAKHAEIYPADSELGIIQIQVSNVERSLKLVSDQLTNQPDESKVTSIAVESSTDGSTVGTTTGTTTTTSVPQRMLKGVMRVGLLAKGLLLRGDREVQLVVLCSQPPTFELLDRVTQALPTHLKAIVPSITFTVHPYPEEALVQIRAIEGHGLIGDIVIKVSFTSPVVREEQLAAAANGPNRNGEVDMKETKEGRLDTKECLHSLALLRRAKWFGARANSLQNCVLVIRVMRDYCRRTPIWSNLDFWAMELIVERAAFSAGTPLSPGDLFRRTLESISAGIILTAGEGWSPGIADPCEKDAIDATGNLTAQDRENITASAQEALRLIAFRQLYKVLGMAKPLPLGSRILNSSNKTSGGPSPGKKRPRENSQSDAISPESEVPADLKKEKIEG